MPTDLPVRLALPSDEEEIMGMCRELDHENGLFPMDEDRVRDVLRMAFEKRGGMLGVVGSPGEIEAMIYMLISQMWSSSVWHLEELWSFVRPQYRKSNNARNLVKFAMRCSDELKLPLVIGIVSNTRTEQKVNLYQRLIHKPNGAFFVYNNTWNHERTVNGHG